MWYNSIKRINRIFLFMKTKKFLSGLALGALLGSAISVFFNPKSGKKNRDKFNKVSKTVSQQLIKEVAKAKKLGKKEYETIVENIVKKYSKEDLLTADAWGEIMNELKLRWTDIQKEIKKKK